MDVREPRPPVLTEGPVRKGGQNLTYQIAPEERPPDPLPMRPERAGREGDQPLPQDGIGESMHVRLARSLPSDILERGQIGIRRYGKILQAFNGRDAHRDLREELLDALAYSEQVAVERAKLEQDLLDERGTREALDARLGRIWDHLPKEVREDADNVEHGVELLATALTAAELAKFKCCPRAAWGDGGHDASCRLRAAQENLAQARAALEAETAARVQVTRERDEAREALDLEVSARKGLEERLGQGAG